MDFVPTNGRFLKKRFGKRVAKVPLALSGFTCPNIDGSLGRGGCTYCDNESFSPNLSKKETKPDQQDKADQQKRELISQYKTTTKKLKKQGFRAFVAYFQSFSNTYAPADQIEPLHDLALSFKDCVGVSIGTRADCIDDQMLDYLIRLNQKTFLTVEIGVQSTHDATLDLINRCEIYSDIEAKIKLLKKSDIRVTAHLIFGLPKESREQMIESTKKVLGLGVDAIKFHPLYVVKNTQLANSFKDGSFASISEDEYIEVLKEAVRLATDRGVVVERVSAGIDNDTLLTPSWCKNKNQTMAKIRQELAKVELNY